MKSLRKMAMILMFPLREEIGVIFDLRVTSSSTWMPRGNNLTVGFRPATSRCYNQAGDRDRVSLFLIGLRRELGISKILCSDNNLARFCGLNDV